eukprot:3849590-Alexandrium_andersonii.AAC.1
MCIRDSCWRVEGARRIRRAPAFHQRRNSSRPATALASAAPFGSLAADYSRQSATRWRCGPARALG